MMKRFNFCTIVMMVLALVLAVVACQSGNNVEKGLETQLDPLDQDGVPDTYDNCPEDPNPPEVVVGENPIMCVVAEDCLLNGDINTLADGTPVPVAENPQGSSLVGIYCVQGSCVMQADNDLDGAGDACDQDDDNDKVADEVDNCPMEANTDQLNTDDDEQGNVCDDDDDNDGEPDETDNCPLVANPDQTDTDGDGDGDACEDDSDGDGVLNEDDNCPLIPNEDQLDTDGDEEGDACDLDDDNDGDEDVTDCEPLNAEVYTGAEELCNGIDDNCDTVVDEGFLDTDIDGIADCMDEDDDNDTILDEDDNCPLIPNIDQTDTDGDTLGDFCDDDLDGDGVLNVDDNCLMVSNPVSDCDEDPDTPDEQCDTDGDGDGDACDNDCDGDGVLNGEDGDSGCHDIDLDGDGYLPPEDCLEGNWEVNPGATEVCDGVDDDCDGVVDDGDICPAGQACIEGECVEQECVEDVECNDDDICTNESCIDGACQYEVIVGCCLEDADCQVGQTCVDNICVTPGECEVNMDCLPGEYCAGGECVEYVDLHGRTPFGAGGANGGPEQDGTPDNWDDDGDGYCEVSPCLGSVNPSFQVDNLLGGDCDDDPDDGAQFQVETENGSFMTDGSYSNHPGAQDWCETAPGMDNDCDGIPNDGC